MTAHGSKPTAPPTSRESALEPRYRRRNSANRVVGRLLHTCLASSAVRSSPRFGCSSSSCHHNTPLIHPPRSPSLHLLPNHYPYRPSPLLPFNRPPSRRTSLHCVHRERLLYSSTYTAAAFCLVSGRLASLARSLGPRRPNACAQSQPAHIADRGTLRRQTHPATVGLFLRVFFANAAQLLLLFLLTTHQFLFVILFSRHGFSPQALGESWRWRRRYVIATVFFSPGVVVGPRPSSPPSHADFFRLPPQQRQYLHPLLRVRLQPQPPLRLRRQRQQRLLVPLLLRYPTVPHL